MVVYDMLLYHFLYSDVGLCNIFIGLTTYIVIMQYLDQKKKNFVFYATLPVTIATRHDIIPRRRCIYSTSRASPEIGRRTLHIVRATSILYLVLKVPLPRAYLGAADCVASNCHIQAGIRNC